MQNPKRGVGIVTGANVEIGANVAIWNYVVIGDVRRLDEDDNWRLQGRMRGIHPTLPNQTFDEEMSVRVGGQEIRMRRVTDGGSSGDAVVYLPAAKVLFLGRCFENGLFPSPGVD